MRLNSGASSRKSAAVPSLDTQPGRGPRHQVPLVRRRYDAAPQTAAAFPARSGAPHAEQRNGSRSPPSRHRCRGSAGCSASAPSAWFTRTGRACQQHVLTTAAAISGRNALTGNIAHIRGNFSQVSPAGALASVAGRAGGSSFWLSAPSGKNLCRQQSRSPVSGNKRHLLSVFGGHNHAVVSSITAALTAGRMPGTGSNVPSVWLAWEDAIRR